MMVPMLAMTYFPGLREPKGTRRRVSWQALCNWLSAPVISAAKDETPGFSLATYEGDRRALANVQQVYAIGLDIDAGLSLSDLRGKFATTSAFVHTTWSSTIDVPRARVFLELSRPVTADEYRRVYLAVVTIAERGGLIVDRAASDPSRFWFRPAVRELGCSFIYWTCEGEPIDVEGALRAVPASIPPPPPSPRPLASGGSSAFDRARKYAMLVPGAVSGSGGSTATFALANKLVRGFALGCDDALVILREWNATCSPPWSEAELVRKVDQAWKAGAHAVGDMLERAER